MRTWASSRVSKRPRLRHSSRSVPLKDSTEPFSQGLPGSMKRVVTPARVRQSRTAVAVNSGPLSDRRYAGGPRSTKSWASRARTASLRSRRATSRLRHSRVYASTRARIRTGRPSAVRILAIGDEDTREGLRLDVARRLRRDDGLARLAQLFVERGPPTFLRSDNGPEFTATAVRDWLHRVGVTTLFIEPGSPWENGYVESFNGKLRDECLNR